MKISRRSIFKHIEKYFVNLKAPVIFLFILCIISAPVAIISPKFFQILIDEVMGQGKTDKLIIVVFGLLLVYVIRLGIDSASLYFTNKTVNGFTYNIRIDIWKKYANAPFEFMEGKETGDLKMRLMEDVNTAALFVKEQLVEYLYSFMTAAAALIVLLMINVKMALISICILPFIFIINSLIAKGSQKVNEQSRILSQKYYTSTNNSLRMWREIKVQNAEQTFIKRFRYFREQFMELGYKSIKYWFYNEVFGNFKLNYLSTVFIYCLGIFFMINKSMSIGYVIMFGEYFGMLFQSIDAINMKNAALKSTFPYYKRITETLTFPEHQEKECKKFVYEKDIDITIPAFSYPNTDKSVLKNLTLTIKKGDFISIIGQSGCGKTTLIKLLVGLYSLESGKILFDGVDLSEILKSGLYKEIGIVMQDSYLFNLSIRENLMLGTDSYTDEEIIEACKKAGTLNFINKLPGKLDALVGEKGVKLSGGQKQKLCIARALLKKPSIIIFDEATSSLDQISEDEIYNSINSLSGGVTIIVISHKPSAILRAAKVATIEEGTITSFGDQKLVAKDNELMQLILNS